MSGNLYTRLTTMPDAGTSSTRYLNSEDTKKMILESATSVLAAIVSDSDYVETGDDTSVTRLLESVLQRDEVSSQQFRPHMWESVFWDPTWARPDKLTSALNKALATDATDNSSLIVTERASTQVREDDVSQF